MAKVELARQAEREIDALPKFIRLRLLDIVHRLEKWPAVSGALAGSFRVRTGNYRIQFHVEGDVVVIDKVGHRDGFYED